MSVLHPIIAVTGSSGAGTTTVSRTFDWIFQREKIRAAYVEGDAFHRYDRAAMRQVIAQAEQQGIRAPSHFGPEANLFVELEALFCEYAARGSGQSRHYLHDDATAALHGRPSGTFTDWKPLPSDTDLLFYEGLHGGVISSEVDLTRHVDLLIGVVPTINLEWIQKTIRDTQERGYSQQAVTEIILHRMDDYVHYMVPQFSRTHINFQRVPVVDTANPFSAHGIPTDDETLVVIHFREPHQVDFPYLLATLPGAWMSRINTLVVPGAYRDMAFQVILTPLITGLVERRRQALQA
ncbi:phosphoribulokinase [Uliginosibacterium gangwonense]|uniref:phosphoribulokinase n=1 Tax=Uliginosibacterium gangwonense TaxID=392736 RepID=UPI00037C752A|nr:phosphoribulokinase [Uliginosibacterium gangwonense]